MAHVHGLNGSNQTDSDKIARTFDNPPPNPATAPPVKEEEHKIRRATRHEERAIENLLEQHCSKLEGSDRYCKYEEGWDDQRICDAVTEMKLHSLPLPLSSVSGIRLSDYGSIRLPQDKRKGAEQMDLEERVKRIEAHLGLD